MTTSSDEAVVIAKYQEGALNKLDFAGRMYEQYYG